MKNAMKKLLSLALAVLLLVSAVPFRASATGNDITVIVKYNDGTPNAEFSFTPNDTAKGSTLENIIKYQVIRENGLADEESGFVQANCDGKTWTSTDGVTILPGKTVAIRFEKAPAEKEPEEPAEPEKPAEPEEPAEPEKPAEPAEPEVKPITIIVKVDSSDNEVWRGTKEPANGKSAKVQDLLNYCWNSSWDDVYTFDHAWSHEQQKNVALSGSINAGDTVYIMVKKTAAPEPTEPDDEDVEIIIGNGDKKILLTLDMNYEGSKDKYIRVTDPKTKMGTIMEAIQKNKLIPTRKNYTFAGWYWDDDFDYKVKDNEYLTSGNTTAVRIYAKWTRNSSSKEAFLKIYINGKTTSPDRIVNVSSYGDSDGSIDIYEARKVVGNYYAAKDSSGLSYDGLFTEDTWKRGAYNDSDEVNSVPVNANDDTFIYIMVYNAKAATSSSSSNNSSSSSSSSSTADTSNPKTGDSVYMVVTVMGLSAAALAAAYVVSKKRAIR